ncbi:MAG: hypothetical protein ABI632_10045 [Pseudolysinimonas sp.]
MMMSPWGRPIAVLLLGLGLASCESHVPPVVPQAKYSTAIVGRWQGTVGDVKEGLTIDGDGTFVCLLHPMGFMARTLSQSVTGTVRGTWNVTGTTVTLTVTSAEHERLRNVTTSSTIVAFNADALVLKSDRGEQTTFRRMAIDLP